MGTSYLVISDRDRDNRNREGALRGLTQEEAAVAIGVRRNSIYLYESDRVTPSEPVVKMASHVYGVPVELLYSEETEIELRRMLEHDGSFKTSGKDVELYNEEDADLVREMYREAHPLIKQSVMSVLRAGLSYREEHGN